MSTFEREMVVGEEEVLKWIVDREKVGIQYMRITARWSDPVTRAMKGSGYLFVNVFSLCAKPAFIGYDVGGAEQGHGVDSAWSFARVDAAQRP